MALMLAVPRRLAEGAKRAPSIEQVGGLVADLDARAPHLAASGSASSAWAASATAVARRAKAFGLSIHYHNRHRAPACASRTRWRRPTGTASTRCWRAWTSSRSTARRTPATFHLLSARRLGADAADQPTSSTPRAATSIDEAALIKLLAGRQDRRRRPRRVRARAGGQPEAGRSSPPRARSSSCRIWARRRIEGRIDMGEKVDHQHPHLLRRPPPAGPRAAEQNVAPARLSCRLTPSGVTNGCHAGTSSSRGILNETDGFA